MMMAALSAILDVLLELRECILRSRKVAGTERLRERLQRVGHAALAVLGGLNGWLSALIPTDGFKVLLQGCKRALRPREVTGAQGFREHLEILFALLERARLR